MEEFLDNIYDSILDGDANAVLNHVEAAIKANVPPEKVLREGMIAAMTEIGRQFEEGDAFVPEMLVSARAMKAGLGV
jgi:5-methyltetrahydrofolate--homocysteine methyltransferase